MPPRHKRPVPLLLTGLVTTLLAVASALASEPASRPAGLPNAAPAVDQNGPTIKEVYKDHFLIGAAGDLPVSYSDAELRLVEENFNVVTPENCMKPGPIQPREN